MPTHDEIEKAVEQLNIIKKNNGVKEGCSCGDCKRNMPNHIALNIAIKYLSNDLFASEGEIEDKEYELAIVSWSKGKYISLNNYRIAGGKAWGGGTVEKSWNIKLKDLFEAIPELKSHRIAEPTMGRDNLVRFLEDYGVDTVNAFNIANALFKRLHE